MRVEKRNLKIVLNSLDMLIWPCNKILKIKLLERGKFLFLYMFFLIFLK